MRLSMVVFVVILSASFVLAQLPEADIVPPPMPSGGEVDFSIELFDSVTHDLVSNMHARITLTDDSEQNTLKYIRDDGLLKFRLLPGEWQMRILVDDIATPGKDYTYDAFFQVRSSVKEQVFLLPAGSVQGTVYNGKVAVPNADVLLYCSGDDAVQTRTDISGSFNVDWLPVGQCRITAVSGDLRGETMAKINQGALAEVSVSLSEGIASGYAWVYLVAIGAVLISIILLVVILLPARQKRARSSRMDDVFTTLGKRERKVIDHLIDNGGKSTQASIRNDTGIPKTTLVRIFQSLEAKNILHIEKIGKMKKVSLTDWFLGRSNGP